MPQQPYSSTGVPNFAPGWVDDPRAVETACEEMAKEGHPVLFGNRTELKGYWNKVLSSGMKGVFNSFAEKKLIGQFQKAEFQRRGTCVGRGTFRAIQDSLFAKIVFRHFVSLPRNIAYEPIYAGSRVNVGGGRIGGDGSIGAWAAQFVSKHGVLPDGKFGQYDLGGDREDLAVRWGARGQGVPRELLNHPLVRKVDAHRCRTAAEMADALAAGYCIAFCSSVRWGNRDRNGISRPAGPTAHCEEVVDVFETVDGDLGFVRQQSWGNQPGGPTTLRYAGGEYELRQGAYGSYASDHDDALRRGGEAWAFEVEEGWRPNDVSELDRQYSARDLLVSV